MKLPTREAMLAAYDRLAVNHADGLNEEAGELLATFPHLLIALAQVLGAIADPMAALAFTYKHGFLAGVVSQQEQQLVDSAINQLETDLHREMLGKPGRVN